MADRLVASVVLFVENVQRMADFYRAVGAMQVVHADNDHVVLAIPGMELVIHGFGGQTGQEAQAAGPVEVREDSYWKFCFPVASIAEARAQAEKLGGRIGGLEKEWEARGFRACDGHDPEGNVLQVRVRAA